MDYKKRLPNLSRYLNQISKKYLEKKINSYQDLSTNKKGSRSQTEKRWKIIKKKLEKDKINNLLDIGSAEGYFLKKTSKMGIMSLGLEADERRYFLSSVINEEKKNYAVINNVISTKLIRALPQFDTVLYLSVHHHIVANIGNHSANKILIEIFKKCKKSMFFETAMKGENSKSWSNNYRKNLNFVTEVNIKKLFMKAGCKNIQLLGYTEAYNKGYKRPLFYISK